MSEIRDRIRYHPFVWRAYAGVRRGFDRYIFGLGQALSWWVIYNSRKDR